MTLTLYQAPVCPFARRTRMVLEHLGLDYENKQIDLDNVPESYKEVSPYGLVPALVHDDNNVYESGVITQYLEGVFEGGLTPADAHERARMRIIMSYADNNWMPAMYQWKIRATGRIEATPQETEEKREALLEHLRWMEETLLDDGPYFLGSELTLADINFATTVPLLADLGMSIPVELTKVARWVDAIRALPAFQRTPTEYEADVPTLTA